MSYYAIDFGTSNSLLSYTDEQKKIQAIALEKDGGHVLRSLMFTPSKSDWYFGESAINAYQDFDGEGRFFRSLKKFLPEKKYTGTEVHNKKLNITELISIFLREMKQRADLQLGKEVDRLVLGRPAKYSLQEEEDELAQKRMHEAAILAGFSEVHFCPEPVAAGLDFKSDSKQEKIILIADFGGGTSDFTLFKSHSGVFSEADILGLNGVFIAGDALDGEFMLRFISKHFGSDFAYKIPLGSNTLKFPKTLLQKICSPAHITHLRERDTWEFLQAIKKFSLDAANEKKLDQLFTLVECQLGFSIFESIEKSKVQISTTSSKTINFEYKYPGIGIHEDIQAALYFEKMQVVCDKIFESLEEVLAQGNVSPADIDEICLTGGTAQFPLIIKYLEAKFGAEKINQHNIYQSVVGGLAHYAKGLF